MYLHFKPIIQNIVKDEFVLLLWWRLQTCLPIQLVQGVWGVAMTEYQVIITITSDFEM